MAQLIGVVQFETSTPNTGAGLPTVGHDGSSSARCCGYKNELRVADCGPVATMEEGGAGGNSAANIYRTVAANHPPGVLIGR